MTEMRVAGNVIAGAKLTRLDLACGQAAFTAGELSNLLSGDEHYVHCHFMRLAVDTLELLPAGRRLSWAKMDADSACCPSNWSTDLDGMPERIRVGWRAWPAIWFDLVWRNPRLRLATALSAIGEIIDASSWPYGREEELRRWVDGGARLPLPWPAAIADEDDVSQAMFEDMRALSRDLRGWVFRDEKTNHRVFRADDGDVS